MDGQQRRSLTKPIQIPIATTGSVRSTCTVPVEQYVGRALNLELIGSLRNRLPMADDGWIAS